MSVSVKTYLSNIINVLIKVVLPSVNSGIARIQLSFAVDLLNQLQNQVEYRNDVMNDDFTTVKEMLHIACIALRDNHITIPEEITSYTEMTSSDQFPPLPNIQEALTQVETASSRALDLMYEKSDNTTNFNEIEKKLLDFSFQWVWRKAKLKPPTINLELLESG